MKDSLIPDLASALALAAVAQAEPSAFVAKTVVAQASAASDSDDDEEATDEDDKPASPEASSPAPASPVPVSPPATAAAAPAPVNTDNQRLVSGAPLYNPNVAVHIVERKQASDRGKHEIVLYPATIQANGKFTQHIGSAASYVYHLQENFGFQVSPLYNWYSSESAFNQELIDKVSEQAPAATSLLLVWGAQAGVEVTPIYGKFAFYEGSLAHFTVVLNGGAGLASTRHQLKPENSAGPATFGDTGMKFLGSVGGGLRVRLGDWMTLRLEVRDLVYTARVDSVNGCDVNDLDAMIGKLNAGQPAASANVRGSCKPERFASDIKTDVRLAQDLVKTPSSDVLNNVGFYAGMSFLF